jgi:hypothetical protein
MRNVHHPPGRKSILLPLLLIVAGMLLAFSKPLFSLVSKARLDAQIIPAAVVMPSIYKVYANEEALHGKYSLFKMILTNNSNNTANNVEVSFEIPGYVNSTVIQKFNKILPGQSVVVNCYPNFPEKIVEKTTASKEKVNISIKGSNVKEDEHSFAVQFKGRNEFVYSFIPSDEILTAEESFDNKNLLSCLVTPEDPIIKYLTQKIQEKVLKGETASVENKEQEGVRVMLGIYEATLRSHMVYSGTSGVPEKIGDVNTITQSIRLPREVMTGKTGLCIELSLLYASIMMCAGMDPIIYLVPGHAYPGFRMNGRYYAIESTGIGGEGMGGRSTAQQAYETGMKSLDKFIQNVQAGNPGYMILDVREAIKEGALAMELKDDTYLRQKIDEIAQSFDGYSPKNVRTEVTTNQRTTNDGGGNAGGNTGLPSGYKAYNGVVYFGYPSSWQSLPRQSYWMPQLVTAMANNAMSVYVEVYNFPGYSNGTQVIQAIQRAVSNNGAYLQYQSSGQTNGYWIFNGTTTGSVTVNWVAAFRSTGNGIGGIAIGALDGVNAEGTAQKILGTLR